ncbi:translation elongation factor Ts [bacterium]|nr:translation elongation factor Ts [bacterium]
MSIAAKDVMKLRQQTGAGMMDCKKALNETNGDFEAAVKYLREKGIASAAKRAGRSANEGRIVVRVNDDHTAGAIVEVNSETDFVARNEEFVKTAEAFGDVAMTFAGKAGDDNLIPVDAFDTTDLQALSGRLGEKMQIARAGYIECDGFVDNYTHPGDQLGVIIALSGAAATSDVAKNLAHELTLQIAAAGPQFVSQDQVPESVIEAEKDIYKTQMRNEGKPEEMLDKIATGKLNKFFEEICLLNQIFVKDSKMKVKDVVAQAVKDAGGEIKVDAFLRFKVGDTTSDEEGGEE